MGQADGKGQANSIPPYTYMEYVWYSSDTPSYPKTKERGLNASYGDVGN